MLPTSTDVTVQTKNKLAGDADAVVVFVVEGAKRIEAAMLSAEDRGAGDRLLKAGVVRGKARELAFDLIEAGKGFRRVYVVGLGKEDKVTTETLRQASGAVAKAFRKHRIRNAAIVVPRSGSINPALAADAIVTGVLLASFQFKEYEGTAKKSAYDAAKELGLRLTILSETKQVRDAVERARVICEGQNFARTIASRPGNVINPQALAKVAGELAREVGLKIRVLDEKEMAKLGMGGILGVGAGSANPPRMIVLEHRGARGSKTATQASPLLVVGKAITFDTGGISIKPAEKMGEMIFDKCGAMAVLGLMYAVGKLKLSVNVVGILSSAENMPSSTAYRPGDILRMYNGVTVEVTNTDAEGRLVLGDALAWGTETYQPSAVVDLATLTGGCVVALGHTMAGLMSNSDDLVEELQSAADQSGEKVWRLPIGDDQREIIKSGHADIVNSAGRWASPLQGGAFLSHFIPRDDSVPWAHLDIAGVADTDKELPYYARGATGWGVRTLVQWVMGHVGSAKGRAKR
jgi:leucyl aminopeptidase